MLRFFLRRAGCHSINPQQLVRSSSSSSFGAVSEVARNVFQHREHSEHGGYVWNSPYEPISLPDMTVDQYVWKNVAKWSNKVAIVCAVTGRKYTYAKLRDHCAAFAIRLRTELGMQPNDMVAICLPNVPEFPIALLGAFEGGLIVTTVNPSYTAEEVSRQFMNCRPKVAVTLVENHGMVKRACELAQMPHIKIICVKTELRQTIETGIIDFLELANPKSIDLSASKYNDTLDFNDTCLMLYSSGTTGIPKGVMLTPNNLTSNCEMMDVKLPLERLILPTTNDYQDVVPCILPFYHCYGLEVLLVSKLALGCKIVTIPKFELNGFVRTVGDHKATFLPLVPPLIVLLGNRLHGRRPEFDHLRQVMSAASSLAQNDVERFKQIAPQTEFFQGYGLTETSPIATLSPKGIQNYSTVGWTASNCQTKIVDVDDPTFKGVNTNVPGELWIRGPNVMKGYYRNEEATRATITPDGWLRSGDICTYDEHGLIYIRDRIKELIKVNANQVAPAELEAVLRDHPDVLEAVVVGVPHPICGELPRAFVVKRPGSTVTEDEIKAFVAKQVIKYKQLTGGVDFIDDIPKTATGKILRREVKKKYC